MGNIKRLALVCGFFCMSLAPAQAAGPFSVLFAVDTILQLLPEASRLGSLSGSPDFEESAMAASALNERVGLLPDPAPAFYWRGARVLAPGTLEIGYAFSSLRPNEIDIGSLDASLRGPFLALSCSRGFFFRVWMEKGGYLRHSVFSSEGVLVRSYEAQIGVCP